MNIRISVRIENPTPDEVSHEPRLDFEEAERPYVEYICVHQADTVCTHPGNLKPEDGKPGVLTNRTSEIFLAPAESILVEYKYSLVLPDAFFYAHTFGTRTIGVTVHVDAPKFDAWTDLQWERKPLYQIGDHITIRWKPSPPASVAAGVVPDPQV